MPDMIPNWPLPAVAVGQTVWIFDYNSRVYAKPEPGERLSGAPLARGYYVPWTITGETRASWVASQAGNRVKKLSKKERDPMVAYNQQELDDLVFAAENVHKIGDMLRSIPPGKLREVATLVGYVAAPERTP